MKNRIAILIEEKYGDMRSSEKQAADYVLAHMDKVRELSLEKLAANSGVSQPTIVRMTKALGFKGYKEFRYAVVEQLAGSRKEDSRANPMYGYNLSRKDRLEDIPGKVAVTSQMMMEETLKNLSSEVFKKVIGALKNARIIDIYSVENSNAVASDLLTKLLYLGLSCRHFDDYYHQKISAGNLTSQDVAVGISYFGYSRDTVEVMKEAKKKRSSYHCNHKFQGFSDYEIRRSGNLHQSAAAFLRRRYFFQNSTDDDRGYDLYGPDRFRLRPFLYSS